MNIEKVQLDYYDELCKRYEALKQQMDEIVSLFNDSFDDESILMAYIMRRRNIIYSRYDREKRPMPMGRGLKIIAKNLILKERINKQLKEFDEKYQLQNMEYLN